MCSTFLEGPPSRFGCVYIFFVIIACVYEPSAVTLQSGLSVPRWQVGERWDTSQDWDMEMNRGGGEKFKIVSQNYFGETDGWQAG